MGCGAAEATGLGFVCVLSANRVDLGSFCYINFPILPLPPCSPSQDKSDNVKLASLLMASMDALKVKSAKWALLVHENIPVLIPVIQ